MTDQIHNFINARDAESPLDIVPVAGRIGAEIRGVALSGDLDPVTLAAIRAALVRHKVIFFRDQDALTDQRHEEFAALLGDPVAHPTVPVAEGSRYLLELDSTEGYAASSWHTDVTFVEAYPQASILRAITIPQAGGDTLWANGATAYDDLHCRGARRTVVCVVRVCLRWCVARVVRLRSSVRASVPFVLRF